MQIEQHLHGPFEFLTPGEDLVLDHGARNSMLLGKSQSASIRAV